MSDNHTLRMYYQDKEVRYFEAERSDMLSFIPPNSSMILEVGCGYGNFARLVKEEFSAQVWGVEIEERAAAVAAQKIDRAICSAFHRNLDLPPKAFNCIIFNDVLEHLVDPFDALLHCKDLLSEDGVVIASIPNVRYFYNLVDLVIHGNWEYRDEGILDKTHLRFFTRRSILSTFDRLGYQIDTIQGLNPVEEMSLPGQFKYLNWLLKLFAKQIDDTRYLQFAIVAKLNKS